MQFKGGIDNIGLISKSSTNSLNFLIKENTYVNNSGECPTRKIATTNIQYLGAEKLPSLTGYY